MKRWSAAAVVALALLVPHQQVAGFWTQQICGGSTLQSCVDFQLSYDDTDGVYYFSVTYASSLAGDPGVITSIGIYDLAGNPDFVFSDVSVVQPINWSLGECQVSGDGVGANLFEACANSSPDRISNGIPVGSTVIFRFTSNLPITLADLTSSGGLGARAHIQSFEVNDCSIKFDSRTGIFSGPDGGIDNCGVSVPEPGTMALLGTGLVGVLGMAGIRRRRKGLDVENG